MSIRVHTDDGDRTLRLDPADADLSVSAALRRHGLPLNTRCAGRGLCDGCRVDLVRGTLIRTATGETIRAGDLPVELRACEHRFDADGTVELRVPERSRMSYRPQVLTDFELAVPCANLPLADPAGDAVGAAIDVGTTTVALLLVRLGTGEVLARASGFNRQMDYGDDVLTRINLCLTNPSLVGRMQEAVVNETIAPLLDEALRAAQTPRDRLACIVAAGNTTMMHLLAGEDPSAMGLHPFTPRFLDHRATPLGALEFRWPGEFRAAFDRGEGPAVHLLPGAAAYIGSDLTAGAVASGLVYDDGPSLLVDVGTNGEVLLRHRGRVIGCATAAGPAFEGAKMADGMRAGDGAISHLAFDPGSWRVRREVIADARPIGVCGSAYVDFLAEGARHGILLPGGRFDPDHPAVRAHATERVNCHARQFAVATRTGGERICITEADLAALLQAKAAIAAGILTLLDREHLTPGRVATLYLAGGFGMHMNTAHAIACGLLPGFTAAQVKLVGNTSLAGAYAALIDRGVLDEIIRAAAGVEVIELNQQPGFEDCYIDQLTLAPIHAPPEAVS